MSLCSVLYISQSYIDFPRKAYQVGDIVRSSKIWNRRAGITGALAFTETHFCQYLEGPQVSIGETIIRILSDERHGRIDVVRISTVEERMFSDWSLAFSGPEPFAHAYLQPLIERDRGVNADIDLLIDSWLRFLHEMAAATQTHI